MPKSIQIGFYILLILGLGPVGLAQNGPFSISNLDIGFGAGLILTAGAGEIVNRLPDHGKRTATAPYLNANTVNRFDRPFAGKWNLGAKRWSDGLAIGLMVSPAALFAMYDERDDFFKIAMMGTEAALLTYGLTNLTKGIARRPRPFLYGTEAPAEERTKRDAARSFFSGHTAFTATALFFGASVFDAYHPYSPWRPLVWGGAIGGSALVGFLRMRAGKHFPTDVLVGYVVGINAGLLIPWLHKRENVKGRVLAFSCSGNAVGLNLRF